MHRSALTEPGARPAGGQEVSLSVRQGAKGPEALNVQLVGRPERAIADGSTELQAPSRGRWRCPTRLRRLVPSGTACDRPLGPASPEPRFAVVTRVEPARRFMFARTDDGLDIFVHATLFARTGLPVREGDRVRLSVEQAARGPRAVTLELC